MKTLTLIFAHELRDTLLRTVGYEMILTRDGDYFVPLERHIAIARDNSVDVFISLHADSLAEGQAHGATVHVLARDASDVATAKLAERHDRDDLLAGADLTQPMTKSPERFWISLGARRSPEPKPWRTRLWMGWRRPAGRSIVGRCGGSRFLC